ncbi:MAG: VCBS repeat-containing protein [Planctomycetota bacterium]
MGPHTALASAAWLAAVVLAFPGDAAAAPQLASPVDLTNTVASPRLLAPSDIDGDGDLDVIVAEADGPNLFGFRRAGGTFAQRELLARIPGDRAEWRLGDLDGNGTIDAVAASVDACRVYVVFDIGRDSDPRPARLDAIGGRTVGLEIGDVDGNGSLDIVVAVDGVTAETKGIFVLRGNQSAGFDPPARLTPWNVNPSLITTGAVTLADLDQDQRLDLVVTDAGHARFVAYRSTSAGYLVGPTVIADGFRAVMCADVGDLDGDGDRDVLCVAASDPAQGPSQLEVLAFETRSNSFTFGALGPVATFGGGGWDVGRASVVDVDGDGDLDALLPRAGADSLWFENDGSGLVPVQRTLPSEADWRTSELALADLDGDGLRDVLQACATHQVGWSRAIGGGAFEPPAEITGRVVDAGAMTRIDIDRDGDSDLAIVEGATGAVVAIENRRVDGFGPPTPIGVQRPGIDDLAAGDLDGDGDDDLVLASYGGGWIAISTHEASGLGAPQTLWTFPPSSGGTLTIVDVDQDGDDDLVVTRRSAGSVLSFDQTPAGLSSTPRALVNGLPGVVDLAVCDLDADGSNDLVISGPGFGGTLSWFRGQGAGAYAPRQAISLINFSPSEIVAYDADGDGDLDLAVAGGGAIFPLIEWIPQVAPGQFGPAVYAGSSVLGWSSLDAGDVDLDGKLDLIGTPRSQVDETTEVTVYSFPYGGLPSSIQRPLGVSSVLVDDLDDDGDADVVLTSTDSGAVTLLEGVARTFVGQPGCAGLANSTGRRARLELLGSSRIADADLIARAYDLPHDAFTAFIVSSADRTPFTPAGSSGVVCLGGSVGVFAAPGQVTLTGDSGEGSLVIDLGALPRPSGSVAAAAGETWYFQAWYRDAPAGVPTSNFSDSASIELR